MFSRSSWGRDCWGIRMVNSDLVQLTFTGTTFVGGKKTMWRLDGMNEWSRKDIFFFTCLPRHELTSKIGCSKPSVGFIPVCVQYHQQLVAFWDERGRLLSATPAPQQGVGLTGAVVNRHRVIVAFLWQAVTVLQVHHWEEEFDTVSCCKSDAPVAVDVVWINAGEMRTGEVAAHSWQALLAFTCSEYNLSDKGDCNSLPWFVHISCYQEADEKIDITLAGYKMGSNSHRPISGAQQRPSVNKNNPPGNSTWPGYSQVFYCCCILTL